MKKTKLYFPSVSFIIKHGLLVVFTSVISSGLFALLDYGVLELISKVF